MRSRERLRREHLSVACRLYITVLAVVALTFVPAGLRLALENPGRALLWVAFLAVTSFRSIPILPRANLDLTFSGPVLAAASVLLPQPLAVLVSLLGRVNEREFRPDTQGWAIVFNRAQGALSAGAAAFAAMAVDAVLAGQSRLVALLAATVAASVALNCVNTIATTLLYSLRGLPIRQATRILVVRFPSSRSLGLTMVVGLALLIVVLYDLVAPASVLLLALPLWLGYSAVRSARESEDRAEELTARVRELEMLNLLGTELLTTRRHEQAEEIARKALCTALDTPSVVVSLAGVIPEDLRLVKVRGGGGAAIGVPADIDERSMKVVEAAAGLIGMALQRLDLEEALGEVERARANLAGKIIEEATRERSRVALEIHDEVLPYLAAAEIQADNVRSAIGGQDSTQADQLASATRRAVHGGINRLRQVLDALTVQTVVPGGLREALNKSLEQLRLENGVDGRLTVIPEPLPPLPLAVEILVMEVVRGCLSNVAKHARAHNVVVQLNATDSLLTVCVHDDGRGFTPETVPAGHHGLALMQQRVELVLGRFTVHSGERAGTRIEVEVPL
ncbi:MAG: sensor histidine kinase [Egibacteraceae bacterium]